MTTPSILLVVGALGLIGCLILLFFGIQMMRDERAAKEAKEGLAAAGPASDASPPEPQAGAPPTLPAATSAPARANPLSGVAARLGSGRTRGNAHEVLRVLRDNLTGRLLIEIGGQRYTSLSDLQDPTLYEGWLMTLRDLNDFGGAPATETTAASKAAVPPALNPTAAVPHSALEPQPSPPARPTGPAAAARPLPAPSMNPFKQMQVLRELAKNPPPAPKSIAEQIDDVLQGRILGTPLVHRGIRMRPGPRGEAIFDLDGQSYPSVDDVPDSEVREVIRAAIAEWEKGSG